MSVSKMTAEERQALVGKLAACIEKHGLEDKLAVKTSRETVCALAASTTDDKFTIAVEKDFAPD